MSEPTTCRTERVDKAIPTVHESALRLQEQFALTGAYNAQDLNRVLGDPREGVTFEVPEPYSLGGSRSADHCVVHHFSAFVEPG